MLGHVVTLDTDEAAVSLHQVFQLVEALVSALPIPGEFFLQLVDELVLCGVDVGLPFQAGTDERADQSRHGNRSRKNRDPYRLAHALAFSGSTGITGVSSLTVVDSFESTDRLIAS